MANRRGKWERSVQPDCCGSVLMIWNMGFNSGPLRVRNNTSLEAVYVCVGGGDSNGQDQQRDPGHGHAERELPEGVIRSTFLSDSSSRCMNTYIE